MVGDIVSGETGSVEDMAARMGVGTPWRTGAADPDQLAQWGGNPSPADLLARLRRHPELQHPRRHRSAIVGGLTDNNAAPARQPGSLPECGRRITDFDMSGGDETTPLNGGVSHLPDDHPQSGAGHLSWPRLRWLSA